MTENVPLGFNISTSADAKAFTALSESVLNSKKQRNLKMDICEWPS